jgi:hypothetical protein
MFTRVPADVDPLQQELCVVDARSVLLPKQAISGALKLLSEHLPLGDHGLLHLKRVRPSTGQPGSMEVLLGSAARLESASADELGPEDRLHPRVLDLVAAGRLVQVPRPSR